MLKRAALVLLIGAVASTARAEPGAPSDAIACLPGDIEGMACIPGGPFIRGSDAPRTCQQGEVRRIPTDEPNHRPVSTIHLSTFYMD
ncbi:MAG: hypothetical protein QF464_19180, partial [Myxococcota bacterium]|nr:hypothetical protein [Myxococcota bacterium]